MFKGEKHLLSTEFLVTGEIKTHILPNTYIGRRLFWNWWANGDEQPHYFTGKRWETIETIHVGNISLGCIGGLICKWSCLFSEYNHMWNNCQHYVRDIVSGLDFGAAKRLNLLLEDYRYNLDRRMRSKYRSLDMYCLFRKIVEDGVLISILEYKISSDLSSKK